MEPLAPGTEDDPLYIQASRPSKKEAVEEQALSKKAILPNGKYDTIFELNYVEGSQHWFCRICECLVLGKLFNHEIGKRHLGNLEKWNWNTHFEGRDSSNNAEGGGSETPMVVAPGEPVPPGFEGEIESVTMIQGRLDGFNAGPLVGLEYLLELLDYDPTKEPSYLCILCDKKGDPRTVLTHLSSYNHQVMYLQKHFPTVYRHIAPYMVKAFKRNWQSGLQKIAEAIENTFGRLKPMPVEAGKFDKDRMLYIEIVAKGKHFSELSGHTFENVVTKEDLTKVYEEAKPYDSSLPFRKTVPQLVNKRKSPSPPVVARPIKRQRPPPEGLRARKRSLSPVSDISSSDLEDFDPSSNTKNENRRSDATPKPPASDKWNEAWRRSPSRKKDGPMPWQKANYGRSKQPYSALASDRRKDEKAEKMEEFKKLSKAIDNDMEQVLKKHKLNPEKHPKYNDEWKKFWNLRYKELQAQGKNAATHDFKPEWIEFWNKRMLELHQEEIKTKKLSLRKRLGLPDEATPISFKIGERRKLVEPAGRDNKPLPTAAQPDSDPEVIIIEDNDKDSVRSHSSSSKNRRNSPSPLRKRDRSPQFRRRSPTGRTNSPPMRRRNSPVASTRRPSPSSNRRPSPLVGRPSPAVQKSSRRISPSPRRRSLEKNSPPPLKPSPPKRSPRRERGDGRFSSPSRRYSVERSPGPDRFGTSRMRRSKERSRSRGRSRELSWERDRHRDYDDKHSYRFYRSRGGHGPWESPPLSRDRLYAPMLNPYAPPKVMRDVTRQPVHYPDSDKDDNEDVNIVGVLRLLTALEEKLGSLGPKVIDLLAQALAMEKKTANSSEELLDNEMNCVLFETVKEKLKGQLQAGFVDRIQEKAFKIAIKKTASLIHIAGQRKNRRRWNNQRNRW
ncbi:hypothetical protein WA026_001180 [Henosepilachna vigintioctopunctata]|uniref:Uncharacterized protein n=1 Tax=Henosepilachna vigintioctopunctata TaxID=420089 RepID=A0AAW1UR11_9CUCU